jgi:hypothetical protein
MPDTNLKLNTQHNVIQHSSIKCYYAECRIFIVILSVVEPPQHLFILTMDILTLTLNIAWHSYHYMNQGILKGEVSPYC